MKIPFRKTRGGVTVNVRVQPRSSKKGVEITGDGLKVKLTAPPADGAANEQLVEVLSEAFGVGKRSIHIIKGLSSKNKVVEIEGLEEL